MNLCLLHCFLNLFQKIYFCETNLSTDTILQRSKFSHLWISPPSGANVNKAPSFDSFSYQSAYCGKWVKGLYLHTFILLNIHHLYYYFK
jgi:hypothetical protein